MGSQKLTSFVLAGYLENGVNVVISPGMNWFKNRGSSDQKRRMSGIE